MSSDERLGNLDQFSHERIFARLTEFKNICLKVSSRLRNRQTMNYKASLNVKEEALRGDTGQ